MAFITIKDGYVKVLNIVQDAPTTVEKLIDSAPEIIDKISDMTKKDKEEDK